MTKHRSRLVLVIPVTFLLLACPRRPHLRDFGITPAERDQVIRGAMAKVEQNYVFPDVGRKMSAAVAARAARGEYASIISAVPLAQKLTDDLREVSHDKHLHFEFDERGVPDGEPDPSSAEQRRQMASANFGFSKVERLDGNIGYIDIRVFEPPAFGGPTATAAMSFVAHCDALIIDLRRNRGGEPDMIAYVASYLFDEPRHLNDIYLRTTGKTEQWWTKAGVEGLRYGGTKPVYVLTSKRTFSGGEELAYDLKALHRATILGETTGGGAHPVQPYKVSEHFAIGVPFARAINPVTKTNWEGTGVAPDIAVDADDAFDRAYQLALEKLASASRNPEQRAELQRLLR